MAPGADARDPRYRALAARDWRFDGTFFVGVTTTGIYCRPVCLARTPRPQHCVFYRSAAEAERDGYRPCLRCRPELAPGLAPVDAASHFADAAVRLIDRGVMDHGGGVAALATALGFSVRQTSRMVSEHFGVSPIELAQTRRLLLAKRLFTDTDLSVHEVANAAGFGSVRRLNHLFATRYGFSPTSLRRAYRERGSSARPQATGAGTRQFAAAGAMMARFTLAWRPPMAWDCLLQFLADRAIDGVEHIEGGCWYRTLAIGACIGHLAVRPRAERCEVEVAISDSLLPVTAEVLRRVRDLFDLDARPDLIDAHLRTDAGLQEAVDCRPGLRTPGVIDGFEVAVRAVIGQQVSVRAARTIACRLAERFGARILCSNGEAPARGRPGRLTPTAATLAGVSPETLIGIGLTGTRARTILRLAELVAEGGLSLEAGSPASEVVPRLREIPGIGPWTAGYIAMRCLRSPDHYPVGDLILRRGLGHETSAAELERRSQHWRPWRSYAAMHLWACAAESTLFATRRPRTQPTRR